MLISKFKQTELLEAILKLKLDDTYGFLDIPVTHICTDEYFDKNIIYEVFQTQYLKDLDNEDKLEIYFSFLSKLYENKEIDFYDINSSLFWFFNKIFKINNSKNKVIYEKEINDFYIQSSFLNSDKIIYKNDDCIDSFQLKTKNKIKSTNNKEIVIKEYTIKHIRIENL